MIALLAAVPLETTLLLRQMAPMEIVSCGGMNLYRGRLGGLGVELLHSGVGKANAAAAATLLALRRPEALIVFGVGGAYPGSGLGVGDLALASCEIFGDEGVLSPAGFLDLETMKLPLLNDDPAPLYNRCPVDPGWLELAETRLADYATQTGIRCISGPFVTVSTCSGTAAAGAVLQQRTGGLCENMEGAAAALVAARNHLPFCEVRGISNLVEDRDLSRWDLAGAAQRAQEAVMRILDPACRVIPA